MLPVETYYNLLAADQSPQADAVLGAGLAHAEPPYLVRIAGLLLARRRDTAWAGLVAHHDRITLDVRQQLDADRPLLRAAVTVALRSETSAARRNTLRWLTEQPDPHLASSIVECLCDRSSDVREQAALALRALAEYLLVDEDSRLPRPGCPRPGPGDRSRMVAALREALRTFDVHLQLDVIQLCLWFARELGEPLWETLSPRRAQSAYAVTERLESWNHPRLAGFLMLALGRPAWRRAAVELLNRWRDRSELLALLEHTDLLADPAIASALHYLDGQGWLAALRPWLESLPRAAKARVPFWIAELALPDAERIRLLQLWLAAPFPEVRRAAVYALAALGTPAAARILGSLAAQKSPLGYFARWYLAGRFPAGHTWGLAPAAAAEVLP